VRNERDRRRPCRRRSTPRRRGKIAREVLAADSNHDGLLDRAEAAAGMPRVGKHFDEADTNHDGKLSQAEVAEYVMKIRAARR